ncbi:MAG TPA: cytochrome c oxidase assembly protein [Candidatus Angelobacter sp.]|nr:cytochrome c oxidase assembly protein [Candidatus Angelobacter sp.]
MIAVIQLRFGWSIPFWPSAAIAGAWLLYINGWRHIRQSKLALPEWRALCFTLGLSTLWFALSSPLDSLDDVLLTAHMAQHFLLMSVAPPLIVLGAPVLPILHGVPRLALPIIAGIFRLRIFHSIARAVVDPVIAWIAMNTAYIFWHVPQAFELALHSENWHNLEHLCFFWTSVAFWWVVIQPQQSRQPTSRWMLVPYLLAADIVNTIVSAFLVFSGRVLYSTYAQAPRVCRLDALSDQIAAGAAMWVLGSIIFLGFAIPILYRSLSSRLSTSIA